MNGSGAVVQMSNSFQDVQEILWFLCCDWWCLLLLFCCPCYVFSSSQRYFFDCISQFCLRIDLMLFDINLQSSEGQSIDEKEGHEAFLH